MAEKDKFIGTIIISNEHQIDLFKVHVYEKSIRFDPKFANGIASSDNVSKEIFEIDSKWKSGTIGKDDIFPMMVQVVGKYEPHLSGYYFGRSELDVQGRYVGEIVGKTKIAEIMFEDRMRMYYSYLNGSGKMKKISRKEFEKCIPNDEISKLYLDVFESGGISYFKYETVDVHRKHKMCYVMTKASAIKFAFCI